MAQMSRPLALDPYTAFRFSIDIDGESNVGGFNEVSGLVLETEVQTLRVGGVNEYEYQLPGPSKFPSRLVLKRGMGDVKFLWNWYRAVYQGEIKRKKVTVNLNDEQGRNLGVLEFQGSMPGEMDWSGFARKQLGSRFRIARTGASRPG